MRTGPFSRRGAILTPVTAQENVIAEDFIMDYVFKKRKGTEIKKQAQATAPHSEGPSI